MPKQITFEIDDAKWETFKKYFLKTHPNQTIDSTSILSDDDWVAYRISLFASGAYQKGFRQEFEQQNIPPFDTNIIKLL